MKTRMATVWALGLVLIIAGSLAGMAQDRSSPSPASQPKTPPATSKPAVTDLAAPLTFSPPSVPRSFDKPGQNAKHPATGAYVSSWFSEIVKLAQAGVDDSVMLTFVDSAGTFNIGADQIIELRDLGVCTEVITAMIDHDFELLSGLRQMPTSAVAASPPRITFPVGSDAPSAQVAQRPTTSALVSVPAEVSSGGISVVVHDQPQFTATDTNDDEWQPVIQQREAPPVPRGFSPVRAPYPVKLTDPIYIFRGAERSPNIVVINQLR